MARGTAVSRAPFEENLTKELEQAGFAADLPQILSGPALPAFDLHAAGPQVLNQLVARPKGGPRRTPILP